ncbi:hypothetical protein BDW62DRAFT_200795 [Aspergillus aurantiobrunneus]
MASLVQTPYETALPGPASEWQLVAGTRLERRLRGVERFVKSSEHFCDGNFQLSFKATLESPLTCEQLKRRHQAAWWRTRRNFPVVGVVFPVLDQASFELQDTAASAQRWASQTCLIATDTTVDDVQLARSRQATDTQTMTLVVDPIRGARGCVLHLSHVLVDVGMHSILQDFIFQLARPDTELGIDAVFTPESPSNTLPRLPRSLSHAYESHYQPTPQDLQHAFTMHQRAQDRWARSSVGIPLHPNSHSRPSRIHNKTVVFEPAESRAAFHFLKKTGITLTAAFFACMTAGIAHLFPAPNSPDGAHLCFSANGRRYLDLAARNGHGPVSMPILPVSMWVDAKDVNLRPTSQRGLVKLARAIEEAQAEDLASPHIIPVFDQLAPALAKAIEDAHNLPGGPPPSPPIGRPTLTSQGQLANELDGQRATASRPGEDPIRISNLNTGGRSTDPSVCFALNSFRDELRFNMLFDERFFDQYDVMLLGHTVARLFRRLVGEEGMAVARL